MMSHYIIVFLTLHTVKPGNKIKHHMEIVEFIYINSTLKLYIYLLRKQVLEEHQWFQEKILSDVKLSKNTNGV